MDLSENFWRLYWKSVEAECIKHSPTSFLTIRSREWTSLITKAAKKACEGYAQQYQGENCIPRCELPVSWKTPTGSRRGRQDVSLLLACAGELVVAFEHEGARWGLNGSSGKDWREEFVKLCGISAKLRILSSYHKIGEGSRLSEFLRERISFLRGEFISIGRGEFLIIFGPEYSPRAPEENWQAFSVTDDGTSLIKLSASGFNPWRSVSDKGVAPVRA